jgi:hypothetical protein
MDVPMAEPSKTRKRVGVQAALDAVGAGPTTALGIQGALNQMRAASGATDEPREPSPLEQLKAAGDVLADAATAAEALLPAMEKRRVELAKELTELESQIVRMRTIIQTAAPYRHHVEQKPVEPIVDAAAGPDIDQVLFSSSQPMKVSEIREQIEKRMGHPWAPSTISNHLSRGKANGRYINDEDGWKLSHKGISDML